MFDSLIKELEALKVILRNWEFFPRNKIGKNLHHIILIHGFSGNKKNLYFIAKHLEKNNFNQIHFFEYSMWQTVESSVAALHKMIEDSPRPVHLIGHSLGGIIARKYTVKNPKRVQSLTTLGAPHFYDWHEKETAIFGSSDMLILQPKIQNGRFVIVKGVGHLSLLTDKQVLTVIDSVLKAKDQHN